MSKKIEVTADMLKTGPSRYKVAGGLCIFVGFVGGIALGLVMGFLSGLSGLGFLVGLAAIVLGILAARKNFDTAYAIERELRAPASETV